MLHEGLKRFDEKSFEEWRQISLDFTRQIEQGYGVYTFEGSPPPEIWTALQMTLEEAKSLLDNPQAQEDEKARHAMIQAIGELKAANLKVMQSEEITHTRLKSYLFSVDQALEDVVWHATIPSIIGKVAKGALNPHNKEIQVKPPILANALMDLGTNKGSKLQFKNLRKHSRYLRNYPESEQIISSESHWIINTSPLEQVLGENYSKTQCNIPIESIDDAKNYLKQQINGAIFEYYFTQIATILDFYSKCKELAQGEDTAQKKGHLSRLLRENGFADLDSIDMQTYLDEVAGILGFESAQVLYLHFSGLSQGHNFADYFAIKSKFMANATEGFTKDDLVERLEDVTKRKFEADRSKMKDKNYAQQNWALNNLISAMGYSFNWKKELQKYLVGILDQFVVSGMLDDLEQSHPWIYWAMNKFGQVAPAAVGFVNLNQKLKGIVDSSIANLMAGGLIEDYNLYQEISHPIGMQWTEMKMRDAQAEFEKSKVLAQASVDELRQIHIARLMALKNAQEEYQKAALSSDKTEKDFKSHSVDKAIKALDQSHWVLKVAVYEQISTLDIDQLNKQINILDKGKNAQSKKLKAIESDIQNLRNSQQLSGIGGYFTRLFDNVGRLFGVKTKHINQNEKVEAQIKYKTAQKESLEFGINVDRENKEVLKAHLQYVLEQRDHDLTQIGEHLSEELSSLLKLEDKMHASYGTPYNEPLKHNSKDLLEYHRLKMRVLNGASRCETILKTDSVEKKISMSELEDLARLLKQLDIYLSHKPLEISHTKVESLHHSLSELREKVAIRINEIKLDYQDSLYDQMLKKAQNHVQENSLIDIINFQSITRNVGDLSLLNIELKERLESAIVKQIKDRVNQAKLNEMSTQDLNTLLLQCKHIMYTRGIEQVGQEKPHLDKIGKTYKHLAKKLQEGLLEKFQIFDIMNLIELSENLSPFDEMSTNLSTLVQAKQRYEDLQASYDSYLYNPFGLMVSEAEVRLAYAHWLARQDAFETSIPIIENSIELLLSKAQDSAQALDYEKWVEISENFRRPYENMIEQLVGKNIAPIIERKLKETVSTLDIIKSEHLFHNVKMLEVLKKEVYQKHAALNHLDKKILDEVSQSNTYPVALAQQYKEQLEEYQHLTFVHREQIQILEDKMISQRNMRAILGYETRNWSTIKEDLDSVQDKADTNYTQTLKQAQAHDFWEDIIQGKDVLDIRLDLEKQTLIMGLGLAAQHNRSDIFQAIYQQVDTIPSGTYIDALKHMAHNQEIEILEQMILNPKGASVDFKSIISIIEKLIDANEQDPILENDAITKFIPILLLSRNIPLDYEHASKLCRQINRLNHHYMSDEVHQNILIDHDYEKLKLIQGGYELQAMMLKHLDEKIEELNMLLAEQHMMLPSERENPAHMTKNINSSFDKIKSYRQNVSQIFGPHIVQNKERREHYETIWDKDIAKISDEIQQRLSHLNQAWQERDMIDEKKSGFFSRLTHQSNQKKRLQLKEDVQGYNLEGFERHLKKLDAQKLQSTDVWDLMETILIGSKEEFIQPLVEFIKDQSYADDTMYRAMDYALTNDKQLCLDALFDSLPQDMDVRPLLMNMKNDAPIMKRDIQRIGRLVGHFLVEMDDKLAEKVHAMASQIETKFEKVKPYRAWTIGFGDADLSKLEKLKSGFVLLEAAFEHYSDQAMLISNGLLENYTEEDLEALQAHMDVILKEINYLQFVFIEDYVEIVSNDISNKGRVNSHVQMWKDSLVNSFNFKHIASVAEDIDQELNRMRHKAAPNI